MSWDASFDEPIRLPSDKILRTLREAGEYVSYLPAKVHNQSKWQTAMSVLIAATEGGPTMMARIGLMKAIGPQSEPVCDTNRKNDWRTAVR